MQTNTTGWNEMIKKEARGLNDFHLGEVQEVGPNFIITEKGTISKSYYYVPKYLVRGFDGHKLWFNVTEAQAETEFKRSNRPTPDEYYRYRTPNVSADVENWVPSIPP